MVRASQQVKVLLRLVDAGGRGVVGAPVRWLPRWSGEQGLPVGAPCGDAVLQTNGEGEATWTCDWIEDGPLARRLSAEASFDGDAAHGEAAAQVDVDLTAAVPKLQFDAPRKRWDVHEPAWTLQVRTVDPLDGSPLANLPVQVQLDGRDTLQLTTGESGEAVARLPWQAVGALGPHTARVVTSGGAGNTAEASLPFEVHSRVDVATSVDEVTSGDNCGGIAVTGAGWCLRGQARAALPTGDVAVAHAAVTLSAGDRPIGALATDGDGRFCGLLRRAVLAPLAKEGRLVVHVHVASEQPWVDAGASAPLALAVPDHAATLEWLVAAVLACVGVGLVIAVWLKRRQRRLQERQLAGQEAGLPAQWAEWGVVSGVSSCRMRGLVVHGETGRPLAAQLRWVAVSAPKVCEVRADDGAFDSGELDPGDWWLEVQCPEHLPVRQKITLPHDGALEGVRLHPVSCRAKVRDDLSAALRRVSGEGIDWSRETPRQVASRWTRWLRRGHREVRETVKVSERALFGRYTAASDVEAVRSAIQQVDGAQR